MLRSRHLARAALVLAVLHLAAAVADELTDPGKKIFEQRCRTCHGGPSAPDTAIGPSLAGIIGRKAGTGNSGVHSRAAIESDTVWTRSALRRYLSEPGREMPGTVMPVQVQDPKELDELLNYLESLR
jgi:cytochrome c2